MSENAFKSWGKIPRGLDVIITEKIDGTNACIIIQEGAIIGVQSRKRLITPQKDNHGFAAWVEENKEELLKLGDGYHYGEWAGPGIQKNPHNLDVKTFFLFDTKRWHLYNPNLPAGCSVVPILYSGLLRDGVINDVMEDLLGSAAGKYTPEGIIVNYWKLSGMTKHTFKNSEGKWRNR